MRQFSLLPLLLFPLTLFCWYKAYNLNKEANISFYKKNDNDLKSFSNNVQYLKKDFDKDIIIDDKLDNLFYFIQVIYYYYKLERYKLLES
jgi:hypothetical protein